MTKLVMFASFLITMELFAYYNYHLIEVKRKGINHLLHGLYAMAGIVIFCLIGEMVGIHSEWSAPMVILFGMPVFDISLNFLRGKPWYYLGTPAPNQDDAIIDRIKERIPGYWGWMFVIAIGALLSFFIYGHLSFEDVWYMNY